MMRHVATCLIAIAFGIPLLAAEPDYAGIKKNVKAGDTVKTDPIGNQAFGKEQKNLRTDGGILVGFDVGVSKFFDDDWIVALKPIYRNEKGTFAGEELGAFDVLKHRDDGVKKAGIKKETLTAKPGYAVAGITMITGLGISHFSLIYAKTTEKGLDMSDTYLSGIVGSDAKDWRRTVKTDGKFIVGVTARVKEKENIVRGVGIIHLKEGDDPPPPKKDVPEIKPDPKEVDLPKKDKPKENPVAEEKPKVEEKKPEEKPREEKPTEVKQPELKQPEVEAPKTADAKVNETKPSEPVKADKASEDEDAPRGSLQGMMWALVTFGMMLCLTFFLFFVHLIRG